MPAYVTAVATHEFTQRAIAWYLLRAINCTRLDFLETMLIPGQLQDAVVVMVMVSNRGKASALGQK